MTRPAPFPAPPSAIHLGTIRGSTRAFLLPFDALTRGVHLRGAIGAGKTSVIRRLLVGRGIAAPFVHFDYIGTGHRELQAWMATVAAARAVAEHACPELAGITAALLRRTAFLTVGDPDPAIRMDLLRRRRLPGGRREHLRDVVSRAVEILYVKLNDADASLRVRFHRIATSLVTLLAAAERPICEGLTLLDDPSYIAFLDREIEARRFRPSEITFLQYQRAEMEHVLRLRPNDPARSWRAFEDETASTRNSLADFAPGTLLGTIFNDETLPLEAVAFGETSLSITNRDAEDQQKAKAYQAVHALLHGLALHRPDLPGLPNLLVVIDEPWWMRRNLPGILAVSRNLGLSYLVSHQSNNQWEDIGLRSMPQQLRALTNLQITFRPTSFDDAEEDVLHTTELAPDGFALRFVSPSAHTTDPDAAYGSPWDEHELVSSIGFSDQVRYRAQDALRRARFTGVVTEDGEGTDIRFAPAPTFPAVAFGVPILDRYRRAHNAFWRAQLVPRTPYDPRAPIVLAERAPEPPKLPARVATTTTPSDHPPAPEHRAKPRRRRGRGGAPDAA